MSDKPSYLGALNAIVNGERRGFEFLNAWSQMSPDADISLMLKTVALREAEHAATFEKRMCELGYTLREKTDTNFDKTMTLACSDVPHLTKFEKLGYDKTPDEGDEDQLLRLLANKSIDPQTGALLGRFIAEERDSGRILRQAYLLAKERSTQGSVASSETNARPPGRVADELPSWCGARSDKAVVHDYYASVQVSLRRSSRRSSSGQRNRYRTARRWLLPSSPRRSIRTIFLLHSWTWLDTSEALSRVEFHLIRHRLIKRPGVIVVCGGQPDIEDYEQIARHLCRNSLALKP